MMVSPDNGSRFAAIGAHSHFLRQWCTACSPSLLLQLLIADPRLVAKAKARPVLQ